MNPELAKFLAGKSDDELIRFSHAHRPFMADVMQHLPVKGAALEIGCWKGDTTLWLLKQGFARVTVIDTFQGSPEHQMGFNLRAGFDAHTAACKYDIDVMEGTSACRLPELVVRETL